GDAPSKPHPGMVLAATRETGIEPHDTVVVGDTVFDVEMARAAGARAIGVAWGYHPTQALLDAGADAMLGDFSELAGALDRLWRGAPPPAPPVAAAPQTPGLRGPFAGGFSAAALTPLAAAAPAPRPPPPPGVPLRRAPPPP